MQPGEPRSLKWKTKLLRHEASRRRPVKGPNSEATLHSSHSHFPWGFWRHLQNLSSVITSPRKPTRARLRDPRDMERLKPDASPGLVLALALASLGPWPSSCPSVPHSPCLENGGYKCTLFSGPLEELGDMEQAELSAEGWPSLNAW